MDVAEAIRYLGVFLGGGVAGGLAKTLLDHFLAGRRERRTELRPLDRARVDIVRCDAEATLRRAQREMSQPIDWSDGATSDWRAVERAVAELHDWRLAWMWRRFVDAALRLRGATQEERADTGLSVSRHDGVDIIVVPPRLSQRLNVVERHYRRLARRINHLERSR